MHIHIHDDSIIICFLVFCGEKDGIRAHDTDTTIVFLREVLQAASLKCSYEGMHLNVNAHIHAHSNISTHLHQVTRIRTQTRHTPLETFNVALVGACSLSDKSYIRTFEAPTEDGEEGMITAKYSHGAGGLSMPTPLEQNKTPAHDMSNNDRPSFTPEI